MPTADNRHLLLCHDVCQLLSHLLGLAQALGMEVVAVAPVRPETRAARADSTTQVFCVNKSRWQFTLDVIVWSQC